MGKKNPLVLVILMGILLISFFYLVNFNKDEGSGIEIHYYKDGVEVFQLDSLSVIQVNTLNYDEISFEIIGENLGNYPIINMQVDSAEPIQLKDALPTLSKSLESSEIKTLWISDRIDVHQFESFPQPVKFWVNISGESPYIQGKIYDYMELDLYFGSEELIGAISTCEELQNINNKLDANYYLTKDIDCSDTINWNSGEGFVPIGNYGSGNGFIGIFDGKGYIISDLYINRNANGQGLFSGLGRAGYTREHPGPAVGLIKNVGVINVDITSLEGYLVGGLVSYNSYGSIENSYSTGNVRGKGMIGGLVGKSEGGQAVFGGTDFNIINSYSKANVVGTFQQIGGLIGADYGDTKNSYSTGIINGPSYTGGFIGYKFFLSCINNFWDTQTSKQSSSMCGVGKTTAEMKTKSTFTNVGWDFDNVWDINPSINEGYPYLKSTIIT